MLEYQFAIYKVRRHFDFVQMRHYPLTSSPHPKCRPPVVNSKLNQTGSPMAKPNYAFEKRQRELAKKKKKEEKRLRKQPTAVPPEPTGD
jgi:hypothetical protein